MNSLDQRPEFLWCQQSPTISVSRYFRSFRGEFEFDSIESNYPYNGKASALFRRVTQMSDFEASERFDGRGVGCWAPRSDRILNPMTADLLAAADTLVGKLERTSSSSLPGGICADSRTLWVGFLDGGVGVDVSVWEHEYTNRVKARQRTTVRGPTAYRALLELLGFDWINRRLPGEKATPRHDEIKTLVNDLLAKSIP